LHLGYVHQTCKKTNVAAMNRKVMFSPRIGSSGENPSASKTSFVPSTPSSPLRFKRWGFFIRKYLRLFAAVNLFSSQARKERFPSRAASFIISSSKSYHPLRNIFEVFSFLPRVVSAAVPRRIPEGSAGGRVSKGIAFLLTMIPSFSSLSLASLPQFRCHSSKYRQGQDVNPCRRKRLASRERSIHRQTLHSL